MAKRKPISKKTRFEVFKRDSFTCQYCGKKAPNVILEIDHIKPVKEGGDNSILNLVTSCFECNRGKSARKISDNSVVERQRAQIEELNLKRQQLEMMLQWRDSVKEFEDNKYKSAIDYWNENYLESGLTEKGEKTLRKLCKKHSIIKVMDMMDSIWEKIDSDSFEEENDYANHCFKKLETYLYFENRPEYEKKIAYITGILNNQFNYCNKWKARKMIKEYYDYGNDLDSLEQFAKDRHFKNWTAFRVYIENCIEEEGGCDE